MEFEVSLCSKRQIAGTAYSAPNGRQNLRLKHYDSPPGTFRSRADIGIRGIAPTLEQAFEHAATAMTAVI